jgi:ATP-binding cassette, subfamily C (CFTR/MRP), member 1
MDYMSFFVSQNLHHESVRNIFYAPMSFFDTTPMGRILGVFGTLLTVIVHGFTLIISCISGKDIDSQCDRFITRCLWR